MSNVTISQQELKLLCPETGIEFIFVEGGEYHMGDVWGDTDERALPVHQVFVSDFLLGKTAVTQLQWHAVMGENPVAGEGNDFVNDHMPVVKVSWDQVRLFIERLNELTGRQYRLPSEAEWEYAARDKGQQIKWAGTNDLASVAQYSWYNDISGRQIFAVGKKLPNALGFYDMSGSVHEWCEDIWHDNFDGAPCDGSAWLGEDQPRRVMKGGSWCESPIGTSVVRRNRQAQDRGTLFCGFRLAQNV
jgi:formylglycine-generating enzyme required for sulfatase activity